MAKRICLVGGVAPIPLHPSLTIDSPCECEHTNPDSLDARLFPSVVLAIAPAVAMDEASSLCVCVCARVLVMYEPSGVKPNP